MVDVGAVVAGYRLVKALGNGPFGTVFRGEDARGRPLAIKFLKAGFLARADGAAAYSRLGASTAVHSQLAHPYLARVFGTIADSQLNAFGQFGEYLQGLPLNRAPIDPRSLRGHDPQGLATLLTWYEQLGDALGWLHEQGMVHGNIKPTNVLLVQLAEEHHVKLLDLSWSAIGVAAVARGPNSFVSPEQYNGAVPDHLSDQWAVATMLERTFTGGQHRLSLGVLPAALVHAVQRATKNDPGQRFSGMLDFVEAIREIRLDLQRAAGEEVAPHHGASTLPAGQVPSDLTLQGGPKTLPVAPVQSATAAEKPVSASKDVLLEEWELPERTQTLSSPVAQRQRSPNTQQGRGEGAQGRAIPPHLRKTQRRPEPSGTQGPGRSAALAEDEGLDPLVRHAVGDVLSEEPTRGASTRPPPIRPGDTLPGLPNQQIQLEFLHRSPSEGSSPSRFPSADDLKIEPVAAVNPIHGAEGNFADSLSFPIEDSEQLLTQAQVPASSPQNPRSMIVEAAPSPVIASRLAAVFVLLIAVGIGAWSALRHTSRGFTRTPEPVVIATGTVTAPDVVESSAPKLNEIEMQPVKVVEDVEPKPIRPRRKRPSRVHQRATSQLTAHASASVPDAGQTRRVTRRRKRKLRSLDAGIQGVRVPSNKDAGLSNAALAVLNNTPKLAASGASPLPSKDSKEGLSTSGEDASVALISPTTLEKRDAGVGEVKLLDVGVRAEDHSDAGEEPVEIGDPLAQSCENGRQEACLELAVVYSKEGELPKAALAYEDACRLGSSTGCMRAARYMVRQPRGASRARELYVLACEADFAEGCHQASLRTIGARSKAFKARACQLGRSESCRGLVTTSSNTDELR